MQPLSPVDAISPAFSRTRSILYPPGPAPGLNAPFRFWFFVKIATVAALTQANIYGAVFGIAAEVIAVALAIAGGALQARRPLGAVAGGIGPGMLAVLAVILLIAVVVGLLFAWLWCRFRFSLFDLVVYRHGVVARAWSPYASQAWRFLGLMILISLGLLLLVALTAGSLILHLVALFRHLSPQQINADPSLVLAHILPLYGIFFLLILIAGLVNAVAQDFILPPMALEDAPLAASFSRFFQLLRTRFWYIALYLLFRYLLELGMAMVGGIALFIVLLILGGGAAGIGFVLYRAFWHAGPGGVALFVIFCILAALLLFAVYLFLLVVLYGSIAVVKQSYAALFYGSYYPPLGDRLGPPAIPPPAAP
jgi:hypothetical protein